MKRLLLLLLLVLGCIKQPVEVVVTARKLVFLPNTCFVFDTTLNDTFAASPDPLPCQALFINPPLVSQLPEAVALWGIYHESAHLVLDHVLNPPDIELAKYQEAEADCYAAVVIKRFWPLLLPELKATLKENLGKGSIVHGEPEQRYAAVMKCLEEIG